MPAATLRAYRNVRLARGCGLVTVRQRPGTAKGVMFVTLEVIALYSWARINVSHHDTLG
jgi:hypothetical protein